MTLGSAYKAMFIIPFSLNSAMTRSITALPSPIPWYEGSTTTSHTTALNTPSPVARANATGLVGSLVLDSQTREPDTRIVLMVILISYK
jgi:hypothetical protein